MWNQFKHKRAPAIRASELAQLGYCEQKLVFETRLGERRTSARQALMRRGDIAHRRFFQQALAQNSTVAANTKRWCFIASMLFGSDAPETVTLREFRDEYLRINRWGRSLILTYYKLSPRIGSWLTERAVRTRAAKAVIRLVVYCIEARK